MRVPALASLFLLAACSGGDPSDPRAPTTPVPGDIGEGLWMKGDLHLHSHHSHDARDNPMPELIAFAEEVGMDYFLLTDHDNHVGGDVAGNTWADPDHRSDQMVMLYGAEWTTHRGHGNTLSAVPYDHQRLYDARDALDTEIHRISDELGIHFSANHPGGGDAWNFSYDMVDSLEVWNSAIWPVNSDAVVIWDDLLKSGRKLTGRGGSDAHHSVGTNPGPWTENFWQGGGNHVGTPTTWVYARERSGAGVVEALTLGRVSISAAPAAPRIEFYADQDGDGRMDLMMGDVARATGAPVHFRVDMVGGPLPAGGIFNVRVIKDGAEFATLRTVNGSASFTDTPAAEGRSYYRVEVQGQPSAYPQVPAAPLLAAAMVGLSNPIYFNFAPRP